MRERGIALLYGGSVQVLLMTKKFLRLENETIDVAGTRRLVAFDISHFINTQAQVCSESTICTYVQEREGGGRVARSEIVRGRGHSLFFQLSGGLYVRLFFQDFDKTQGAKKLNILPKLNKFGQNSSKISQNRPEIS